MFVVHVSNGKGMDVEVEKTFKRYPIL